MTGPVETTPTIGAALRWWARRDPDAVAVRCAGRVLTRRGLDEWSDDLARRWLAQGVQVDDLVAVALPNSCETVVAFAAAWKAGATPQPLSPRMDAADRAAVLAAGRPAVVLDRVADVPVPRTDRRRHPCRTWPRAAGRPHVLGQHGPTEGRPRGRSRPLRPPGTRRPLRPAVGRAARGGPTDPRRPLRLRGAGPHDRPRARRPAPVRRRRVVAGGGAAPRHLGGPRPVDDARRVAAPGPGAHRRLLAHGRLHLGARCAPWLKRAWIDWLGPDRVHELYAGTESQGLAFTDGRDWTARPGNRGPGPAGVELPRRAPGPQRVRARRGRRGPHAP